MVFVGSKNSIYAGKNASPTVRPKRWKPIWLAASQRKAASTASASIRFCRMRFCKARRSGTRQLAQRAGGSLRHRAGSTGRVLPQTDDAAREHLSAGHRRRHRLLRFFESGENDGLHADGRRRRTGGIYALRLKACSRAKMPDAFTRECLYTRI